MEHFTEQLEMPWLAEVKKPIDVQEDILGRCHDAFDAVIWSWALRSPRSLSQKTMCERCGIKESNFSGMLNRKKYLPIGKLEVFSYAVGNNLVDQWINRDKSNLEYMRLVAITSKKSDAIQAERELTIMERKHQLLAELARLERAA